ncbi:MAB_1171c family putative transporter [Actinopolyspora mortivallis]|uniref:MAB_1171c family putative transporter n=1 Tax=Actinopolyspora mortivallis TaxID=33906 RepID=UPI000362C002|nr:MAB_1171c family putative transporter [Actinopolyspora mortivallis]
MEPVSRTTATIALLVLSCGRLLRLRRTPTDPALLGLNASLLLFLLIEPAPWGTHTTLVHALAGGSSAATVLATHGVRVAAVASLLLFFHYSAHPLPEAHRRARGELLGAAVVVLALVLLTTLPQISAEVGPPGFHLISGGYTAVMTLRAGSWSARYAREVADRMRPGPRVGAFGLWLYGLAVCAEAGAAFLGNTGRMPTTVDTTVRTALHTGRALFLLGLLYPVWLARVDAMRLWARHWRQYRLLTPLWVRLHEVLPPTVGHRERRWRRWVPWRVHRRHWRRTVEIRDALLRLGPQLADLGITVDTPLAEQATAVNTALRRERQGVVPTSGEAVPVAVSDTEDALVRLARAMEDQDHRDTTPLPRRSRER